MSEEQIQDTSAPSSRATAVSVFEQSNGMNDFPVLKAFQEYIEAEQTRARKRMLGLSIFFVVLLVVVVVTFSVIMAAIINRDQQSLSAIATRNQELSDKLLDIALRERERQSSANVVQPTVPAVLPATSPADSANSLQPVLDRLEKLATSLNKPQPPPQVQQVAPVVQPATISSSVQQPITTAPSLTAAQGQQDEIRRQREAIAAERAKLKAEQERLRREEVEQHRRRLYPEYYAQEDARGNTETSVKGLPPPPPISAIRKDEKAASGIPQQSVAPQKKAISTSIPTEGKSRSEGPKIDSKTIVEAKPVDLDSAKPISYFDQDDDSDRPSSSASPSRAPVAPQVIKGENTKAAPGKTETISVGAKGSDQIPWLIELPEAK